MPPKRRNYEARFKLTVVDFAEKSNNSAAGRQFGVSEKLCPRLEETASQNKAAAQLCIYTSIIYLIV